MHIGLVLFIISVIIFWAVLRNISQNDNKNDLNNNILNEGLTENNDEEKIEMEEIFYSEVKNGEKAYKLMNIFNQFDLMFVKSLFQSEQIPYYIESEYTSKIRPGMQIGSFGNADVYILDKDYNDAIIIIEEYRKNKIDLFNNQ
jgi:hypothetical protein